MKDTQIISGIVLIILVIEAVYVRIRLHNSRIKVVEETKRQCANAVNLFLCGVQNSTQELFARHSHLVAGNQIFLDYGDLGFDGSENELEKLAAKISCLSKKHKTIRLFGVSLGARVFLEILNYLPESVLEKTEFHVINGALTPECVKNPAKSIARPLEILSWFWLVDLAGTIALRITHVFGARAETKHLCESTKDRRFKKLIDKASRRKMTFGKFAEKIAFLNQSPGPTDSLSVGKVVNYLSADDSQIDIEKQAASIERIFSAETAKEIVYVHAPHSSLYLEVWGHYLSERGRNHA